MYINPGGKGWHNFVKGGGHYIKCPPSKLSLYCTTEHRKCKIFPGPWSGPHPCCKGFSHACSIVGRFAPPSWNSGKAVSPYPTPLHFRGVGTQYQMSPVSLVHLYHETHVLQCVRPNPVSRHCPQSWVGGGAHNVPQFCWIVCLDATLTLGRYLANMIVWNSRWIRPYVAI
jgi:hypothetical protein